MYFQGTYLRVLKPRTSNGINPIIDGEGRMDYKETFLPLSAKKRLEKINSKLPQHLKMKIETVTDEAPAEKPKKNDKTKS